MLPLNKLQQLFCDALRVPGSPPPALLAELVNDGLAEKRFNIYRNNFIVLNGDALADMYPVIRQLVGEQAFRLLATRYVREHPPAERTLLLYGEAFANFLGGIPELAALPYLADVARLEYAWTDAYHAEDAAPLTQHQVAAILPDAFGRVRLVPHPALHCIRSPYPLLRIWESNQPGAPEQRISLDEGSCNVLVTRPGVEVQLQGISDAEATLLQGLQDGATVEGAVAETLQVDPEFDLAAYLGRHLFDGTFCRIRLDPSDQDRKNQPEETP
ncbi:MAG: putative DNA-binding domain-containing protein [Sedimenticola sp.]|nr:putative DNA-binding domain-containing protein [Sedimenticola sp.]